MERTIIISVVEPLMFRVPFGPSASRLMKVSGLCIRYEDSGVEEEQDKLFESFTK